LDVVVVDFKLLAKHDKLRSSYADTVLGVLQGKNWRGVVGVGPPLENR